MLCRFWPSEETIPVGRWRHALSPLSIPACRPSPCCVLLHSYRRSRNVDCARQVQTHTSAAGRRCTVVSRVCMRKLSRKG